MILLVSDGDHNLWPGPTPEVCDSRTSVTLHMPRVKAGKSDWFWSQSIVFTKPFKTGMFLDVARGLDFQHMTKGTPGDGVVKIVVASTFPFYLIKKKQSEFSLSIANHFSYSYNKQCHICRIKGCFLSRYPWHSSSYSRQESQCDARSPDS